MVSQVTTCVTVQYLETAYQRRKVSCVNFFLRSSAVYVLSGLSLILMIVKKTKQFLRSVGISFKAYT